MPEPARYAGRLAGKVAIVTGAGAEGEAIGIGRAIAVVLAGEGARVCCVDLDPARAEATAARIRSQGGDAFAAAADVSRDADCERVVAEAAGRHGRLDVLVNNVGISPASKLEPFDEAVWTRVLDVNLKSVVLMCRHAVPRMAGGGGGSIVNISSIAGMRASGALAYGAAKAGMAQVSRDIALAYGRAGIRVNTIAPGHLLTAHIAPRLTAELRARRRKVAPLGIEGDAWDVAAAASFLASDEARFISGVELPVDGGLTAIAPLAGADLICADES
jgi:NAD(P)-dependent dehydrogenase (short-subunit alcohol dehydrogenase family)